MLRRVHEGLVSRGRTVTAADADTLLFQGGRPWLALRALNKAIRGTVRVQPNDPGVVVTIEASDNSAFIQSMMLGFERRQYRATLNAELESIEQDLAASGAVAVHRRD